MRYSTLQRIFHLKSCDHEISLKYSLPLALFHSRDLFFEYKRKTRGIWYQIEHTSSCFIYDPLVFAYPITETLFLVFDILLLGVWISDETLLLVFDTVSLLGVWISYEKVFLVFDVLLLLSSLVIEEIKKIIVFFHLNCKVWTTAVQ